MDNNNNRPSRLHIHLGGLVIFIIIILMLFKVDLRSAISSPRFQQNISYVKEQSLNIWDKYLSNPLTKLWDSVYSNLVNKGIEQIKKEVSGLKTSDVNGILPININNPSLDPIQTNGN